MTPTLNVGQKLKWAERFDAFGSPLRTTVRGICGDVFHVDPPPVYYGPAKVFSYLLSDWPSDLVKPKSAADHFRDAVVAADNFNAALSEAAEVLAADKKAREEAKAKATIREVKTIDSWMSNGLRYRLLDNGKVEEFTGCGSYPWVAAPETEASSRLLTLVRIQRQLLDCIDKGTAFAAEVAK